MYLLLMTHGNFSRRFWYFNISCSFILPLTTTDIVMLRRMWSESERADMSNAHIAPNNSRTSVVLMYTLSVCIFTLGLLISLSYLAFLNI
jgi:hypothetical protein